MFLTDVIHLRILSTSFQRPAVHLWLLCRPCVVCPVELKQHTVPFALIGSLTAHLILLTGTSKMYFSWVQTINEETLCTRDLAHGALFRQYSSDNYIIKAVVCAFHKLMWLINWWFIQDRPITKNLYSRELNVTNESKTSRHILKQTEIHAHVWM